MIDCSMKNFFDTIDVLLPYINMSENTVKKIDSNKFFWKKMEDAILFTILAVHSEITCISIFGAKHKHITGKIKLPEYSIALRVIKIVRSIGIIDNKKDFYCFLDTTKRIPEDMKRIIMVIADEWYARKNILYADPNIQEQFKKGLISIDKYIASFYSQQNTFK